MKQLLCILMVTTMLGGTLMACGGKGDTQIKVKDSLEIMDTVWAGFEEEEKFAAIGGDLNNPVDNAPGKYDISDTEGLTYTLNFPEEQLEQIDDCASLVHMMNANTFTGATYHVKDAKNIKSVADAVRENILGTQWMCGFPEELIIVQIGDDYLVVAYGNEDVIDDFEENLTEAYVDAKVLYEESIG